MRAIPYQIFTILVNFGQVYFHRSGASALHRFGENHGMGNNLRRLRDATGMTLEELAAHANTSPQQISRLEKGQRQLTPKWMKRLAPPLGVPGTALLDDSLSAVPALDDATNVAKTPSEIELLQLYRGLIPRDKRLALRFLRNGFQAVERKSDNVRRKQTAKT